MTLSGAVTRIGSTGIAISRAIVIRAITPPKSPNPRRASEEDEAVAALKKLREDAERKRALAIVKPTPENLKSYIVAQEALMDRASVFSDVWRRVIWANPELNYQLRNPSNNSAIQVRDTQRTRKASGDPCELDPGLGSVFLLPVGLPVLPSNGANTEIPVRAVRNCCFPCLS
jgi:hypothetical protein